MPCRKALRTKIALVLGRVGVWNAALFAALGKLSPGDKQVKLGLPTLILGFTVCSGWAFRMVVVGVF